jgi:hypothetical protein
VQYDKDVLTKRKAALLLVIVLFSWIRFRLRDMPLERDEGEYAYAGQLLLQGIPPYQLAYNMKLPGTYAAYAGIFMLFGHSAEAVHMGLILVNAATILLVALLGRRLYGATGGLAAGTCYALLSTSPTVLGFAAHATHFVALAAVAGALLLLEPEGKSTWLILASGVCMGTAMVMKQPGAAFIAFGGVYLLVKRPRILPVYLAGAALPFGLTCLLLWRAGVFEKFWFWTVSYAKQYGSITSLSEFFSLSLLAFSFAAVCAGMYFRNHYFVMMLPAVSLLAGASLANATVTHFRTVLAIFAAGVGLSVFLQRDYLFVLNPAQASDSTYHGNPFPEAQRLASYLREHSSSDARIAVLGSEPEIYFYSGLHSATGYIYTYPLMEPQQYALRMQQEMIAEIEQTRPEYLVFVYSPLSWQRQQASENLIFTWADRFLATQYEPIAAPGLPDLNTFRRRTVVETIGKP